MLKIRYAHLPLPFVQILASNMQAGGKAFAKLRQHFEEHPDLKVILTRSVSDIDSEGKLERVINSIGWLGVRDRIASMYLQRKKLGYYPYTPDLEIAKSLNLLEQRTKDFCVDGHSRAYLFAFYFKMSMLDAIESGVQQKYSEDVISNEVIDLLKLAKAKIIHVDWLLIILQNLNLIWGHEALAARLKAKANWKELFQELQEDQKSEIIDNLLAYGASIGETDLFVAEMI